MRPLRFPTQFDAAFLYASQLSEFIAEQPLLSVGRDER